MGKVLVSGHAEQDFAPDYAEIILAVETEGKTAAKATASTMEEFERLIARLSDLGFKPENMAILADRSGKPYRHDDDDYKACRSLRFRIPVELKLVNRIRDLIASGFENTTFDIKYDLSKRTEIMRSLTIQAIQDSRKTADLLAEATGTKVTGIEAARLDEDDNMNLDITELDFSIIDESGEYMRMNQVPPTGCGTPFSDKLKPDTITMESNVNIVWLLE